MPNKQNARKALRQAAKRAVQNLKVKKTYKQAVKKATAAAGAEIKETLRTAQKALDKARKRGVLTKNTAARKLSRLAKRVQKAK